MPADIHFLRPLWLWLLVPLVMLAWRLLRRQGDGNAWRRLVDPDLLARLLVDSGGWRRRLPVGLLGFGWLLLVLALAGPTWERLPQPVYQPQQFRVVALDLSPSMNATDLSPSRLTHARFEVLDLLRKAQEGQTALLAYGAEPYVVSPLTADVNTIAAQVPSLETSLLPVQGPRRTDLALDEAGDLLRQAGAPEGEVILVTDGLDHPAAARESARKLAAEGYRVSVLGLGTAKGAPVPLEGGGFLKDRGGAIRVAKLDSKALQTLAAAGDGLYVAAAVGDRDIEALLPSRQAARLAQAKQQADTQADQWREEGPWLLLLVLPLAALAFRRGWLSLLLVVVVLLPTPDAHASTWDDFWARPDQQAIKKFEAGETAQAAALFKRPDWRAAAQYEAGDFDQALQSLKGQAGSEAAYNQGNTLARLGRLEEAVDAYDRALAADPEDADARHNRDLVQRLLDQRQPQPAQKGQKGQQAQQGGQARQEGQQGQRDAQEQQGQQGQQDQQAQQGDQGQPFDQSDQGQQGQQGGSSASQRQELVANGQQQNTQQDASQGAPGEQVRAGQQAEDQPLSSARESERSAEPSSKQGQEQGRGLEALESRQATTGSGAERPNVQPPDSQAQREAQVPKRSEQSPGTADHGSSAQQGNEPGLADLLGGNPATPGRPANSQTARIDPEDVQAMEQMLRRVEDDPGGLLRQRFLLQHLRRNGQLP
jgi:Ca-activated chloride channel family protein